MVGEEWRGAVRGGRGRKEGKSHETQPFTYSKELLQCRKEHPPPVILSYFLLVHRCRPRCGAPCVVVWYALAKWRAQAGCASQHPRASGRKRPRGCGSAGLLWRGRAPARPRQRESRGTRQRVALGLGMRRPRLAVLCFGRTRAGTCRQVWLGEWFRDSSQALGANRRVQRALGAAATARSRRRRVALHSMASRAAAAGG